MEDKEFWKPFAQAFNGAFKYGTAAYEFLTDLAKKTKKLITDNNPVGLDKETTETLLGLIGQGLISLGGFGGLKFAPKAIDAITKLVRGRFSNPLKEGFVSSPDIVERGQANDIPVKVMRDAMDMIKNQKDTDKENYEIRLPIGGKLKRFYIPVNDVKFYTIGLGVDERVSIEENRLNILFEEIADMKRVVKPREPLQSPENVTDKTQRTQATYQPRPPVGEEYFAYSSALRNVRLTKHEEETPIKQIDVESMCYALYTGVRNGFATYKQLCTQLKKNNAAPEDFPQSIGFDYKHTDIQKRLSLPVEDINGGAISLKGLRSLFNQLGYTLDIQEKNQSRNK